MGFFRFIRSMLTILAFLVFPIAVVVIADITLVNERLPTFLGELSERSLASEEARAQMVEEWLEDDPELRERLTEAGLDPQLALEQAFSRLSESEKFRSEVRRVSTDVGTRVLEGSDRPITVDMAEIINSSGVDLPPPVQEAIDATPVAEFPIPPEVAEGKSFSDSLSRWRLIAAIAAVSAAIVLAAATKSVRFVLPTMGILGSSLLWIHRAVINLINEDATDVESRIVGEVVRDVFGTPITIGLAACVAMLVAWPVLGKVFPKRDKLTEPEVLGSKPSAEQTQTNVPSFLDGEDDEHDWLLEASGSPIVEESRFGF